MNREGLLKTPPRVARALIRGRSPNSLWDWARTSSGGVPELVMRSGDDALVVRRVRVRAGRPLLEEVPLPRRMVVAQRHGVDAARSFEPGFQAQTMQSRTILSKLAVAAGEGVMIA